MNRTKTTLCIALALALAVAGGAAGLFLFRPQPPAPKPSAAHGDPASGKRYTPQDLLRAILAEEVDPYGDRDILRAVLEGMDPKARAQWMLEIAGMIGVLDPAEHQALQRRMGFFALDGGHLDAGWTMLRPLLECQGCPASARDDAMRLLAQYTDEDDLRRAALNVMVDARAAEVLASESIDTGPLPIVWMSYDRMRHEGRVSESIERQRLYIERFIGTMSAVSLRNAQQTLANDLLQAGRIAEARPLLLQVAEAHRGATMSEERANYLVHASRTGNAQEALSLLEGALGNSTEAQTSATAVVYLELLDLHQRGGDQQQALNVAERYWGARGRFAPSSGGDFAGVSEESQAMICYRASEAATRLGRVAEAETWLRRVIEAAPNSQTAATVRRLLQPAPSP